MDFFLNGRAYADEAAVAEELLDPEEAQRGSRFRLDYLPDPQFSTAKREKWIKHHPGEPLTLVIHVSAVGGGCQRWGGGQAQPWASRVPPLHPQKEQDSLGLESHEYRVKIGQVSCDIQIVSERVIHCSVNESLGTAEGQLPITVSGPCMRGRGGFGPQPCPRCLSNSPPTGTSRLSISKLRSLDKLHQAELYLPTWQMRKLRPKNLVTCSRSVTIPASLMGLGSQRP